MNVGIVTTWFERGAAYVSRQFKEILQQKHNIYIYARGGEAYAMNDPNWDSESVYWSKRVISPLVTTYIDKSDFCKWLHSKKIEIVIFNEQHWFQPILWCKDKKIKTIAYIDYYNEESIPLFDIYDALICNTKRHKDAFSKHKNAYYLPWGTNIDLFIPIKNGNKLVNDDFVTFFHSSGINAKRKGTDILIKSLFYLKGNYKLIIHTQNDIIKQFPDLKTDVEKLINDKKLDIINRTYPAPGLYHLGDVYVYPTRLEGIGLTIAESISCGLPCILPDCPPMNEFVNESFSKLVPILKFYSRKDGYYWPQNECDTLKLADSMNWFIQYSKKISSMKINARSHAESCLSYKKNFESLSSLINDIEFNIPPSLLVDNINKFDLSGIKKINKYFMKMYPIYKLLKK